MDKKLTQLEFEPQDTRKAHKPVIGVKDLIAHQHAGGDSSRLPDIASNN